MIPAKRDAAEISIEFRQSSRTTMVVHIGAYGELPGWEGLNSKQSLTSAAMALFDLVLEGRYREDVWVNVKTGRYGRWPVIPLGRRRGLARLELIPRARCSLQPGQTPG